MNTHFLSSPNFPFQGPCFGIHLIRNENFNGDGWGWGQGISLGNGRIRISPVCKLLLATGEDVKSHQTSCRPYYCFYHILLSLKICSFPKSLLWNQSKGCLGFPTLRAHEQTPQRTRLLLSYLHSSAFLYLMLSFTHFWLKYFSLKDICMPHNFPAKMKNSAQLFGLQNNRQYKLTFINSYSFWNVFLLIDNFENNYLYTWLV